MALASGCGNAPDTKQNTAMKPTTPITPAAMPKQIVGIPQDMADTSPAANPPHTSAGEKTTNGKLGADTEQLRTSRLLHDADRTSSSFTVIGPHTNNVVALYQFFEAAGWNDFVDGLTMKSCPDGYEFFCKTRGMFMELYQKSGGDVNSLVELARNMDLREHFYRLAAAADIYQAQYQAVRSQASNN